MKYLVILSLIANYLFAKIDIAVSILPQKTFVEKIAGNKANVIAMVKPGSSPHTYEPKPSQIKEISNVQLYFPIEIEFENSWLDKFANQNKNMHIVSMTKGVQHILMIKHKHKHDHDNEGENEDQQEDNHHDDEKETYVKPDPHTWTSTLNVKIMVKNIYEALVKVDSINKDFYKTNYLNFLEEINITDKKISEALINVPVNSKFMVFHPSWGYFARDFGLIQFPIEVEGKEPKPKVLLELIRKAKDENIKAIFTQSEFSDKSAKSIANELNIKVLKETPLSEDWSQNLINMANAIANNH